MRTLAAGWYGKLPCAGDFVQRRLPPAFVEPWDAACRQSLVAGASRFGDAWAETFLAARPWRFAVVAGPCGGTGWVGVVGPSRDRVGRVFPLTVAAPLAAGVPDTEWFDAADVALHQAAMGAALHDVDGIVASLPALRPVDAPSFRMPSGETACALFWQGAVPSRGIAATSLPEGLSSLARFEENA